MPSLHSLLPCPTVAAMYKENDGPPPDPVHFVGELEDDEDETDCLRARPKYKEIVSNFARCVCYARTFDSQCRHKPVSQIMSPFLEAYMVFVYVNHYENWIHEISTGQEQDDSASDSGSSSTGQGRGGKFTSKSGGKHKGWNEAGVKFYNNCVKVIMEQRDDSRLGKDFEAQMIEHFNKTMGSKGRAKEKGGRTIAAVNGIANWREYL